MNDLRQKILYGAGAMGKRAFEYYTKDNPDAVYCFADTFKGGKEFCGKPVLSFDDFIKIHKDFDVVISIYNFFDLLFDFEKMGVYSFSVWDDYLSTISYEDMYAPHIEYMKSLNFNEYNDKKKILYGAGNFGRLALLYFGDKNVYAFADKREFGKSFLGKPILNPSEIPSLLEHYEVVITIKYETSIIEDLKNMGVNDFKIFPDDIRAKFEPPLFFNNPLTRDTWSDSQIISELKDLDFIQHPELLNEYNKYYFAAARRMNGIEPDQKYREVGRFIGENYMYGFFDGILQYADRKMKYYEGPSLSHCYRNEALDSMYCKWNNLMESGIFNKEIFHKNNNDVLIFIIGPFLQYIEAFYTQSDFNKYKKKYGKNLTVFPIHSLLGCSISSNENLFISKALNDAKDFDSLTVCTHFNDYNSKIVQLFKSYGANIVSAGYMFDTSFAKRLKSIFLLSDAVLTNGLGSHICHALSLDKPVKIFTNVVIESLIDNNETVNRVFNNHNFIMRTVLERDDYFITNEQIDTYKPFVDFDITLTKEELGAIFDLSKRIIKHCDYKSSKYVDSIRQTYRDLQKATSIEERIQFSLMQGALPIDYDLYLKKLGL